MKQGWEIKKLGDVVTFKSGYTPKDYELSGVGDVPYYKVSDMNHELNTKYLHHTSLFLKDGCKSFPKHSIVFPKNGAAIATNKKRILTRESVVDLNTGIICVSNPYTLNYEYLYLFIQNIDFRLYTRRGAVPTLDSAELKSLPIPIPPIAEQEKIVAELDCLSGIIEKKKQQLKELDNLAQSIFYEMFGDPVENDKGWEKKRLDEIGEIIAGSTPSTADETNWDGDINWVTPAELDVQLYYGETVRKITEKAAKSLTLMPVGTVLLSTRAPIGKIAITTVPMCCNQGFKNIICNECINNVFLYYYLMLTMDNIKALGQGATFKEVSKKNISEYKVIIPDLDKQKQFASKIESIEKQKELIAQSIKETETLFNSRMDYYFN